MGLSSGIRAGAAYVELYTKDSRMVKGLQAAEKKLKAFGDGITSIGTRLAGLGAGVVTPLIGAAKVFSDMGGDLADMSQRTGVSVEALSELGFAAEQSGSDMETLENSLRKMQKQITEAAGGSQSATDALGQLGLTVADLSGLSPDEQLKRIGDRLSGIEDPATKAAVAMEIFGKSGTKLLPLFAGGARGIEELQQQARQLGLTMATEDAQAAEAFGDTLDVVWKVLKKAVFTIGSALAPLLTEVAEGFTRVVVTVSRWIEQNKQLVVWVFKMAAAAVAGGAALIVLGATISGIGAALGAIATVATGIGAAIATLGSIIASILSPIGLVIAGVVALAAYLLYVTGVGEQALNWLASVFMDLKNDALAAFQGISDALAAGDIGLAAKVLWLTLKMEWQKGVNWLQEKWIGFKEFFLSVWTEAVFGLSRIMTNAWAGLQSFWTETVAAMSTAWTVFSSGAVSAWKGAQNFIARGIVHLMGLLDDSVDVEGTLAALDEDFQREQQSRQRDTAQRLSGIETNRQQRQSEIEQQRTGTLGALEQDRQRANADRKRQFDSDLRDSEDALAAARREWEEALAQAATKRAEADSRSGPERVKQAEMDLSGLDDLIDTTQRKVDVVGTFNPLAAANLSSDTLSERTAKASEQVAANTRRLVQEAQHGGLVFA
jgi:TP901 family phage tail tape measure protein